MQSYNKLVFLSVYFGDGQHTNHQTDSATGTAVRSLGFEVGVLPPPPTLPGPELGWLAVADDADVVVVLGVELFVVGGVKTCPGPPPPGCA